MLEVKPIQNPKEQEEACRLCSIVYHPDYFTYGAIENGAIVGAAQCDILGKEAVVYSIRQHTNTPEDIEGMFILGRGVLNFLELCGVEKVVCETDGVQDEKIARIVGFRKEEDGVFRISLVGLFDAHCHSEKK